MTSETGRRRARVVAAAGVVLALAYGVASRFVFSGHTDANQHPALVGGYVAMSIAFLFVVPAALGAVTAFFAPRTSRYRWLAWVLLPLASCTLLMGVVLLLAWEGMICIALATPIFLAMAMLGGAAMGFFIVRAERRGRGPAGVVASFALLPFLLAPVEGRLAVPESARVVETSVAIDASGADVWSQIVRVPAIAESEQPGSLFHRIGIPRPLEATLSHEGVGGVRRARFDSGIEFDETVTEWTEGQGFAFDIRVEPDSIGSTLDRHVQVGGAHFDVLEGRFRIQPAARGVVLHLTSRHRLNTRFNGYAGLWTDAIMRDIHRTVCAVVKRRSEALAAARRASSRVD
ncbi:MAG: hypothetical protein ABW221_02240 [Vicinamibacteria bacterium]